MRHADVIKRHLAVRPILRHLLKKGLVTVATAQDAIAVETEPEQQEATFRLLLQLTPKQMEDLCYYLERTDEADCANFLGASLLPRQPQQQQPFTSGMYFPSNVNNNAIETKETLMEASANPAGHGFDGPMGIQLQSSGVPGTSSELQLPVSEQPKETPTTQTSATPFHSSRRRLFDQKTHDAGTSSKLSAYERLKPRVTPAFRQEVQKPNSHPGTSETATADRKANEHKEDRQEVQKLNLHPEDTSGTRTPNQDNEFRRKVRNHNANADDHNSKDDEDTTSIQDLTLTDDLAKHVEDVTSPLDKVRWKDGKYVGTDYVRLHIQKFFTKKEVHTRKEGDVNIQETQTKESKITEETTRGKDNKKRTVRKETTEEKWEEIKTAAVEAPKKAESLKSVASLQEIKTEEPEKTGKEAKTEKQSKNPAQVRKAASIGSLLNKKSSASPKPGISPSRKSLTKPRPFSAYVFGTKDTSPDMEADAQEETIHQSPAPTILRIPRAKSVELVHINKKENQHQHQSQNAATQARITQKCPAASILRMAKAKSLEKMEDKKSDSKGQQGGSQKIEKQEQIKTSKVQPVSSLQDNAKRERKPESPFQFAVYKPKVKSQDEKKSQEETKSQEKVHKENKDDTKTQQRSQKNKELFQNNEPIATNTEVKGQNKKMMKHEEPKQHFEIIESSVKCFQQVPSRSASRQSVTSSGTQSSVDRMSDIILKNKEKKNSLNYRKQYRSPSASPPKELPVIIARETTVKLRDQYRLTLKEKETEKENKSKDKEEKLIEALKEEKLQNEDQTKAEEPPQVKTWDARGPGKKTQVLGEAEELRNGPLADETHIPRAENRYEAEARRVLAEMQNRMQYEDAYRRGYLFPSIPMGPELSAQSYPEVKEQPTEYGEEMVNPTQDAFRIGYLFPMGQMHPERQERPKGPREEATDDAQRKRYVFSGRPMGSELHTQTHPEVQEQPLEGLRTSSAPRIKKYESERNLPHRSEGLEQQRTAGIGYWSTVSLPNVKDIDDTGKTKTNLNKWKETNLDTSSESSGGGGDRSLKFHPGLDPNFSPNFPMGNEDPRFFVQSVLNEGRLAYPTNPDPSNAMQRERAPPNAIERERALPNATEMERVQPNAMYRERASPSAVKLERMLSPVVEPDTAQPNTIYRGQAPPNAIKVEKVQPKAIHTKHKAAWKKTDLDPPGTIYGVFGSGFQENREIYRSEIDPDPPTQHRDIDPKYWTATEESPRWYTEERQDSEFSRYLNGNASFREDFERRDLHLEGNDNDWQNHHEQHLHQDPLGRNKTHRRELQSHNQIPKDYIQSYPRLQEYPSTDLDFGYQTRSYFDEPERYNHLEDAQPPDDPDEQGYYAQDPRAAAQEYLRLYSLESPTTIEMDQVPPNAMAQPNAIGLDRISPHPFEADRKPAYSEYNGQHRYDLGTLDDEGIQNQKRFDSDFLERDPRDHFAREWKNPGTVDQYDKYPDDFHRNQEYQYRYDSDENTRYNEGQPPRHYQEESPYPYSIRTLYGDPSGYQDAQTPEYWERIPIEGQYSPPVVRNTTIWSPSVEDTVPQQGQPARGHRHPSGTEDRPRRNRVPSQDNSDLGFHEMSFTSLPLSEPLLNTPRDSSHRNSRQGATQVNQSHHPSYQGHSDNQSGDRSLRQPSNPADADIYENLRPVETFWRDRSMDLARKGQQQEWDWSSGDHVTSPGLSHDFSPNPRHHHRHPKRSHSDAMHRSRDSLGSAGKASKPDKQRSMSYRFRPQSEHMEQHKDMIQEYLDEINRNIPASEPKKPPSSKKKRHSHGHSHGHPSGPEYRDSAKASKRHSSFMGKKTTRGQDEYLMGDTKPSAQSLPRSIRFSDIPQEYRDPYPEPVVPDTDHRRFFSKGKKKSKKRDKDVNAFFLSQV